MLQARPPLQTHIVSVPTMGQYWYIKISLNRNLKGFLSCFSVSDYGLIIMLYALICPARANPSN